MTQPSAPSSGSKRVGILTLPLWKNYGGIMQAVALSGFLHARGFSPVLIQREPMRCAWKIALLRLLERAPTAGLRQYRFADSLARLHRPFIERHIALRTRFAHTAEDLDASVREAGLDAVVVGSDQVWRYDYIRDSRYTDYFLKFLGDSAVKRIAYAASFGTSAWEAPDKLDEIAELLGRFSHVSVRESGGAAFCRDRLGRADCAVALDPTLLVDPAFYDRFLCADAPGGPADEAPLLAYVLDRSPEKKSLIEHIRATRPAWDRTACEDNGTEAAPKTIERWLLDFRSAGLVVTDSFHGMVFAIVFRKPFVVTGNTARGASRFESLLQMLDLQHRLLAPGHGPAELGRLLRQRIDYEAVHQRLHLLRQSSSDFLLRALAS